MEIEFIDVSISNILNNISFKILKGEILALICDDKQVLLDLLLLYQKPTNGSVLFDKEEFNKDSNNNTINDIKIKISLVKNYTEKKFLTNNVQDELELYINPLTKEKDKKYLDALKLVNLSSFILERNPNSLSSIEKSKLSLACVLITNPSLIVLDNIEFGMNYAEKKDLKKLLIKLKERYRKTIIVISDDVDFLTILVDNYLVINKGEITLMGTKKDFYNEKLYNYCDKPKIIEFIKYVNKKGHQIEEYTDLKELIKGIYRDV